MLGYKFEKMNVPENVIDPNDPMVEYTDNDILAGSIKPRKLSRKIS